MKIRGNIFDISCTSGQEKGIMRIKEYNFFSSFSSPLFGFATDAFLNNIYHIEAMMPRFFQYKEKSKTKAAQIGAAFVQLNCSRGSSYHKFRPDALDTIGKGTPGCRFG